MQAAAERQLPITDSKAVPATIVLLPAQELDELIQVSDEAHLKMSAQALTASPNQSSGAMYTGVPCKGRLVLWVSSSMATARPASAILALLSGVSSTLGLCRVHMRLSAHTEAQEPEKPGWGVQYGITLMSK